MEMMDTGKGGGKQKKMTVRVDFSADGRYAYVADYFLHALYFA